MAQGYGDVTRAAQDLVAEGDLAGAQALLDQALGTADPSPGNASEELTEAAGLQARILIALGEPHAARGWAAFAYAAAMRQFGVSDPRTVTAAATLAAVLHRVGSDTRAARLYRDVIIELTALDGPESLRVLAAHADLATVEYALGRCELARNRLTDAWELHREVYGEAHPGGIKMLARLGSMERDCGRFTEAHDHLALARELCRRHLPPDDPLTRQVAALARAPADPRHVCGSDRDGNVAAGDVAAGDVAAGDVAAGGVAAGGVAAGGVAAGGADDAGPQPPPSTPPSTPAEPPRREGRSAAAHSGAPVPPYIPPPRQPAPDDFAATPYPSLAEPPGEGWWPPDEAEPPPWTGDAGDNASGGAAEGGYPGTYDAAYQQGYDAAGTGIRPVFEEPTDPAFGPVGYRSGGSAQPQPGRNAADPNGQHAGTAPAWDAAAGDEGQHAGAPPAWDATADREGQHAGAAPAWNVTADHQDQAAAAWDGTARDGTGYDDAQAGWNAPAGQEAGHDDAGPGWEDAARHEAGYGATQAGWNAPADQEAGYGAGQPGWTGTADREAGYDAGQPGWTGTADREAGYGDGQPGWTGTADREAGYDDGQPGWTGTADREADRGAGEAAGGVPPTGGGTAAAVPAEGAGTDGPAPADEPGWPAGEGWSAGPGWYRRPGTVSDPAEGRPDRAGVPAQSAPGVHRLPDVRRADRLPAAIHRPEDGTRRRMLPVVVAGLLVVLLGALAVIVGFALSGDPPPPDSGPSGGPGSAPPATATGGAATPAPPAGRGAPPADVKLKDSGDSVTLSWVYPAGAEGPVVIAGGRRGQQPQAFQDLPAGTHNFTVYGLSTAQDYCFTVGIAYSADTVGRSRQVCTNRRR
ncbi:tetratricopeptide repeat protein [Plantactinospora siamensis]|uniref:Tetratricopeptide repeat protein n=1 Tax=Plantactinospora siamensis TaxID=555372 RepID=A0ABV6NS23_9ACTN